MFLRLQNQYEQNFIFNGKVSRSSRDSFDQPSEVEKLRQLVSAQLIWSRDPRIGELAPKLLN